MDEHGNPETEEEVYLTNLAHSWEKEVGKLQFEIDELKSINKDLQDGRKLFIEQIAQLRDALEDAYGGISTLKPDALGTSYTDDQQAYSIRDELLHNIAKALAATSDGTTQPQPETSE